MINPITTLVWCDVTIEIIIFACYQTKRILSQSSLLMHGCLHCIYVRVASVPCQGRAERLRNNPLQSWLFHNHSYPIPFYFFPATQTWAASRAGPGGASRRRRWPAGGPGRSRPSAKGRPSLPAALPAAPTRVAEATPCTWHLSSSAQWVSQSHLLEQSIRNRALGQPWPGRARTGWRHTWCKPGLLSWMLKDRGFRAPVN